MDGVAADSEEVPSPMIKSTVCVALISKNYKVAIQITLPKVDGEVECAVEVN